MRFLLKQTKSKVKDKDLTPFFFQFGSRIRPQRGHFMMHGDEIEAILGLTITEGYQGPPDLLSAEERKELTKIRAMPPEEALEHLKKQMRPYEPSDPGRPWRDAYVQTSARRFLQERVLPVWIKNHPPQHGQCSNIRVDDWGRQLCRWINPNNGIEGPWENPTHYLFYYYNTYGNSVAYGSLRGFLVNNCNIQLP